MNIKETIEKDIEYVFNKLENLRVNYPLTSDNTEPDFRPYRSMVYCLIDTFNNYGYVNNYKIENDKFIEYFINKLTYEIKTLHETIEEHKENYKIFKCLNDAFIKLIRFKKETIKEEIIKPIVNAFKQSYKENINTNDNDEKEIGVVLMSEDELKKYKQNKQKANNMFKVLDNQ